MAIVTVGLIFAGANPFDSALPEAITVDIVSPNEVETRAGEPAAAPAVGQETAPSFEPPAPAPQPQPPSTPQATTLPGQRTMGQAAAPTQAVPSSPSLIPWLQPPPEAPPPAQTQELTPADMFGLPLTMPDGRLGGTFDAPAIERANIPNDNVAAFRKHLKTCSILPAGVTAEARVTLRIHLNPDGTLTTGLDQNPRAVGLVYGVPVGGGDLYMAAVAAVRKCQPYNMLPPDQYDEWKTLDLTFTRENF
jgi:hypothetical protein